MDGQLHFAILKPCQTLLSGAGHLLGAQWTIDHKPREKAATTHKLQVGETATQDMNGCVFHRMVLADPIDQIE
jgi:hypothetical protein